MTTVDSDWDQLNHDIVNCERCERLRSYCAQIAQTKRRAYAGETYWGQPVPNFGDPHARLLIVGLAPGAHGANRTGRMFTGDRSGDWLYQALHKVGFASQPQSNSRGDGLTLIDCAITAAGHCAPPDNKPTPDELRQCREWFRRTLDLIPARVFLALGQIAWKALVVELRMRMWLTGKTPKFGHAAEVPLVDGRSLIGSFHPSQQNTFTGKLTESSFDQVFTRVRELLVPTM